MLSFLSLTTFLVFIEAVLCPHSQNGLAPNCIGLKLKKRFQKHNTKDIKKKEKKKREHDGVGEFWNRAKETGFSD